MPFGFLGISANITRPAKSSASLRVFSAFRLLGHFCPDRDAMVGIAEQCLQCLSASWAFLPQIGQSRFLQSLTGLQCLSASWAFLPESLNTRCTSAVEVFSAFRLLGHFCQEKDMKYRITILVFSAFRLLGHFCQYGKPQYTVRKKRSSVPFGFLGISAQCSLASFMKSLLESSVPFGFLGISAVKSRSKT